MANPSDNAGTEDATKEQAEPISGPDQSDFKACESFKAASKGKEHRFETIPAKNDRSAEKQRGYRPKQSNH
jgi:hypothetical protein